MSVPEKSQTLAMPPTHVKRWKVYVGTTEYAPMTLSGAARFAKGQMWGRNRVITLEPVMVEIKGKRVPR